MKMRNPAFNKNLSQHRFAAMALAVIAALPGTLLSSAVQAQLVLEEVVVTARRVEETLQEVPLTATALNSESLERNMVRAIEDMGRLVPNMQVVTTANGSSSAIYLRGIGSSTISEAFDPAVALNIDGVVLSASRMIRAGQLDMRQIEVLKGPQSLYFGKSATAGVISVLSNDPGDTLEVMVRGAYSPEHDESRLEAVLSGPLTDSFGARLAIATSATDELRENLYPDVANQWRGQESTDARLTLNWDVTDNFSAKFKGYVSEYENDGPNLNVGMVCAEGGQMQQTLVPSTGAVLPPGYYSCQRDETIALPDVPEALLPSPEDPTYSDWNNGVPFVDQDSELYSLQLDWQLNDSINFTSISAWLDLENNYADIFDFSQGLGASTARQRYESFSQEFRLQTSLSGSLNFSAGVYYADIDREFISGQNALNVGLVFPDFATGNGHDWDKQNFTKSESWSGFGAVYWDVTERLQLTAGARYSEDEKTSEIRIPYMHFLLESSGFLPGGTVITDGLEFEDDNWSPEVSASYALRDSVNLYLAYKSGYKAGGIDNSALPSGGLGSGDVSGLIYDSETGEGVEAGIKSDWLGRRLRLNVSVYQYVYDDLQVQQFDASVIQFQTFNAGEITTQGAEAEFVYLPALDGLQFHGALAWTDAEFSDTFINGEGQDLDGKNVSRSADWAGQLGLLYDWSLGANWNLGLSADARYNSGYRLADEFNPLEQDAYWLYDASIRLYSSDQRWDLALLGRNLSDEIVYYNAQARPFACATDPVSGGCQPPVANRELDQATPSSRGLEYALQLTYRY
ncbi:MAG: TonB-dependent receptor [Halioglobus sp.]